MNIGTGLLKIVATATLLGGVSFSGAASASALVQVHNNTPALSASKMTGHHNPRAKLDISVALKLRNPGELDAFIASLHDRSSPNYHKYLTATQFRDTYGPTQAQVDAVKAFLVSQGIKVTSVSANRTRVHGTATTAVMESAFGVAINDYKYQGTTFYSASGDPSLPENVGALVTGVMGLDSAVTLKPHSIQGPKVAQPRSGAGPSGYSPQQIAAFYGWPDITDTNNGEGATIAIATAFTFRQQDLQKFWATYGLPNHGPTIVPIDGTTRVLNGETTLDIERSSAMAPGAIIVVYEASTPAFVTFDDEFVQIATDNSAQVVTTSWGSAESDKATNLDPHLVPNASIVSEHASFQQMAAQGQVVLAAAGDDGASDRTTGNDAADFPSSDPYVIAAGGTTLPDIDDHSSEVAWTGAGGADSKLFAEPSYQTSVPGWASNTACDDDHTLDFVDLGCTGAGAATRQNSDISMDANPGTGYSIYYNGRWEVFGGTSFVAPELAGLFAILASQNLGDNGGKLGPGPALIYCAATFGDYAGDFNDITSGSNGFPAAAGWDHPTGWGTPKATALLADITANCL